MAKSGGPIAAMKPKTSKDPKDPGEGGDGSNGGVHIWNMPTGQHKKEFDAKQGGAAGTELRRASWRELLD